MQKIIVSFIILFCICCDAEGPLDVDLYWQKVSTGEFTWCENAGVQVANIMVYDDSTDDIVLDEVGPCKNSLHYYSRGFGGYYTVEVKGYQYDGMISDWNLVLTWHKVCDRLRVNGEDTEIYTCDVPLTNKEERFRDYKTTGRTARMATPLLENF
jgi:hypothetical protein